jgi:hypothetical protein
MPRHWIAAGLAGGVIAVVRPYYAVVILAAAVYVVVSRRDLRLLFLPEFLIAGGMSVAYMAVFYLAYPVYFEELLPLLRETYMAFSWPLYRLGLQAAPWLAIVAVYNIFAKRGGRTVLADLLLVCACAAWVPYFIQGKGWDYHAYPAIYLGSAAVIFTGCNLLFDRTILAARSMKSMEIAGLALIAVLVAHLRFFDDGVPSSRLVEPVRAQISSPTVGSLSGDIAAGHPLTRMIGGRWIEPYCSDWIATFALRLEGQALERGDAERAGYFERMLASYLAAKRERLMNAPPDVLIVDENDHLVEMMRADYGFAQLLAEYVKIGSDGGIAVYRYVKQTASSPASASD